MRDYETRRQDRLLWYAERIKHILYLAKDAPPKDVVDKYWEDAVPAIEIWFDEGVNIFHAVKNIIECITLLESQQVVA